MSTGKAGQTASEVQDIMAINLNKAKENKDSLEMTSAKTNDMKEGPKGFAA
eukprot:CAMPEP_0176463818 /NCGR_PEP_ID=MMETSP0127-20121128/36124_1 /TAXON_ID=938130 /ORGANISM="Platyophrya macrostoma, Strain WH" /LENGTH=50 /DNA_ID=CAMNT_0017856069 /DNA_START=26 /DNA_END=174 /DNA_ORIENTATION=+